MKKIIILMTVIFLFFTGLSFAAQKTITKYMRAGDMGSSGDNLPPLGGQGTPGAVIVDLNAKTVSLGNNNNDSSGSAWYNGDSDIAYCVEGKCIFGIGLRAYFEFTFTSTDTSTDSTARGDGFTFAIINGLYNAKNSTGGPPAGISEGELLGYSGPGRTDGLGLRPPKMAVEFDTFPNGSGDVCLAGSRNDANNNNHMALMFWGDNPTGNCTVSGTNYLKSTFDDNRHGAGTGDNPVNSSSSDSTSDGLRGYYAGAKNGSFNWLEDGQLHRFRIEIVRATTPVSGNYPYNIKAWVDCPGCTAGQLTTFKNLTVPYVDLTPQINRTVSLTATDHAAFNTMLFGWTEGTGASIQTILVQNFNIYFPRNPCSYGTNPVSASYDNAAHSGNSISVLAGATCAWTAVSNNAWITNVSPANGTANGTVTYNVLANPGPDRTGTINIGDQVFTVTQTSGCSYTVTGVQTTTFAAGGGNDAYSVTTISGCPWTTSNNGNTWITITPASATSTTTGNITVAANTGIARAGTITIAGQNFTISQASGCSYAVGSVTTSYTAAGGSDTYTVTTDSSCPWTTSNNGNTWITITPANATGSTTTGNITVAANTGIARSGIIAIAGQNFTISQSNGCTYTYGTCPSTFPAGGGTASISVTTNTGCTWTSTDNKSWLHTSPTSSSGSGSVTVTVDSHTAGARNGTVTINGTMGNNASTTCTINQN